MSSRDEQTLLEYGIHVPSRTIILTGEVDEDMYERLLLGLTLIKARFEDPEDLTIELNSEGGDWYHGIAIYDRLKACGIPVTVRASGMAMSMGSIILQAGDKRLITPGSTVMVHDGADAVEGKPSDVLIWAQHGQNICELMYKIYATASGKSTKFWKARCKKDFILSAEQAIKIGLADGYIK